ncbi:MAG: serine/threonine-protein kinase [Planctomycetota bacterium]
MGRALRPAPQLAALAAPSSADGAPTLVRSPVAPTLVQRGPGPGGLPSPAADDPRRRAVESYRAARALDPRFVPHAELALQTLDELGRGGMGVVHRVRDERLGRQAALKLLSPELLGDPGAQARFLREAELTASLDHPAIPPIYEAGTRANGQPFLLMKVIEGRAFSQLLRAAGPRPSGRPLRELLEVVVKVGEAVAHAHARGILHRDLKPQNVMVGELGEVMVVDWGLARRVDEPDAPRRPEAPLREGLTQAGAVLGTPGYLPPEQADGEHVGPPADVFALGAILTEVLTGQPPVTGASVVNKLAATLQGKIEAPRDRRRDVPAALDAIARAALAPDPKDRTPSASAFVDDLRAYLADEPVSVYRESPLARARRWARRHPALTSAAWVSGASALVVVGVAATLLARASTERALREDAERGARAATAAREAAQASADALAAAQARLQRLLEVERLPLEDPEAKSTLRALRKELVAAPDELMLRQLARIYLLRGDWSHAAELSLQAALAADPGREPPFADVFRAYALRVSRIGLDEFSRHLEGRGPYFGDLPPQDLDALAARGWSADSGFPAFARALRAVAREDEQDLEGALGQVRAALDRASAPGARAALGLLASHLRYHLARDEAGYREAEAFAQAALATGVYPAFAELMRALALRGQIPGRPAAALEAVDACEAALARDPTLGLAYAELQRIHNTIGAPPLVLEADYTAALRFRSQDAQLRHWRGQTRLTLAQQNQPPWQTRGWAQRAEEDFAFAVAAWDRAAEAHGFNVGQLNSRVELSLARMLQGRGPEAFEVLERCEALAQDAGSSPQERRAVQGVLLQHVVFLLQSERSDAARPRVDRLLAEWPQDPNGHYFDGVLRLAAGDRAGAAAALGRLERLTPDSAQTRDLRAKLGG